MLMNIQVLDSLSIRGSAPRFSKVSGRLPACPTGDWQSWGSGIGRAAEVERLRGLLCSIPTFKACGVL